MSSSSDAGAGPLADTPSRRAPSWPRIAVVAGVLVIAFVISKTSGAEVTQEEAIAAATAQVDFVPEDTQIRLLRQGLDRHPFWIISLSIPRADGVGYKELAVVRIDAESGEIVEFREQKGAKGDSEQVP